LAAATGGGNGRAGIFAMVMWKLLGLMCGVFSAILVWSQITLASPVSLSPLSPVISAEGVGVAARVALAFVFFSYFAGCVIYALFNIRLSQFYHMHGNRRTDPDSLLFNGSYMLRLITPTSFLFVTMMREADYTAFQSTMGQMRAVPFFGSDFIAYFPVFVLLFAAATYKNVYGKLLRFLRVSSAEIGGKFEADVVLEGKHFLDQAVSDFAIAAGNGVMDRQTNLKKKVKGAIKGVIRGKRHDPVTLSKEERGGLLSAMDSPEDIEQPV